MPHPTKSSLATASVCLALAATGAALFKMAWNFRITFPGAEYISIAMVEAMGACWGAMFGVAFGRLRAYIVVGLCMAVPVMLVADAVVCIVPILLR